jgi:hypothetical protein
MEDLVKNSFSAEKLVKVTFGYLYTCTTRRQPRRREGAVGGSAHLLIGMP